MSACPDCRAAWYTDCWVLRSMIALAMSVSSLAESSDVVDSSTWPRRAWAASRRVLSAPIVPRAVVTSSRFAVSRTSAGPRSPATLPERRSAAIVRSVESSFVSGAPLPRTSTPGTLIWTETPGPIWRAIGAVSPP